MMMDGSLTEWSVYRSGFVKKRNLLGIFFTVYAVLDDTTLVFYDDETESDEQDRFHVTRDWTIEPKDGFDFKICDPTNSNLDLYLSVDSFQNLEAWLLALTQSINGPFRESEKFELQKSSDQCCDHQDFDSRTFESSFCNDFADPSFTLKSTLYKQDSSIIFTKYWKKIWCTLNSNCVLEYSENEDFTDRVCIPLDDQAKVVILPENFQGQAYGLSLLTVEPKKDSYRNLRLGTNDESLLRLWCDYLNYCIEGFSKDKFVLLLNDGNDTRGTMDTPNCSDNDSESVATTSPLISNKPPVKPKKTYYLRDETAMARLHRLLSSRNTHTKDNDNLQALYWDHFCTAVPDSPYVIVEVFEHQRYSVFPRRGFNVLNLLVTDPSKLSNHSGVKFPDRYLKRTEPPQGYRWITDAEVSGVLQSSQVELALIYSPEGWSTHPSYPSEDIDENGWTYASSFDHLRKRCKEGKSRSVPKMTDVVRRRRWLRVASSLDEPTKVHTLFSKLGAY